MQEKRPGNKCSNPSLVALPDRPTIPDTLRRPSKLPEDDVEAIRVPPQQQLEADGSSLHDHQLSPRTPVGFAAKVLAAAGLADELTS